MKTKTSINFKPWVVVILSSLIFTAGCFPAGTNEAQGLSTITPKEAFELIQKEKDNPDFVIIDIRTPREFKAGHIKGAVLIDYYSKDFLKKMKALDTEKIYLIYCRSANRSTRTLGKIKDMGFVSLYNMGKGIKGWVKQGFPVYKDVKN